MKRVFSLLTPTAIIAAIFINGITPAQAQEVVLTSMFNSVVVQRSPNSPSQQVESAPPPPDNGAPSDRTGAGTRAHWCQLKRSYPVGAHFSRKRSHRDANLTRSNLDL